MEGYKVLKILYFDYWTGGIHNFTAIDKELKEQGHETLLFHIGSFNESVPKEEIINGINCYDIAYYDTSFLYKALKEIKPDIVVSLNTTYIFDRVLIQSCHVLNIKTIFMMHGIRATGDELQKAMIETEKNYGKLNRKLLKAFKYVNTVIPNYMYSSYLFSRKEFFKLKFLKVILDYFFNTGRALYYPICQEELLHNKCLVYAKKYIEYYEKVGYNLENIVVTGDPKQDILLHKIQNKNFNKNSLSESIQNILKQGIKYAVYLEDSFVESGNMFGWNNQKRNEHINEIAQRLEKENIKLIVKVHPTTNVKDLNLSSANCIVVEKTDLESLIYFSKFCIAYISSTVNIAVLTKKPILIPRWGISKNIYDYFISNNVGNKWESIDEELNLDINQEARNNYIDNNIGSLDPVALKSILKEILHNEK